MGEFTENEKFKGGPMVSVHIDVNNVLVSDKPIMTAREAIDLVMGEIYDRAEKVAVAIFCHDDLTPICTATVDRGGTPHNRMFTPKDIVQTALLYNASYVTLLYSHPGLSLGEENCSPSGDYIAITKAIADACNKVNIKVYNSIVISSFKESPSAELEPIYHSIMERCFKGF